MTIQGAIQQLHDMRCNEKFPIYYKPAIDEVIKTIVADAQEVRHGRWERRGYHLHCSCCDWSTDLATPYYPGCGAYLGGDAK